MDSFTSIVAHLTIADCRPKRLDHAVDTCEKQILAAAQRGMGYRGSYLLVSRDSSQVIALSLWDTAADALTFQGSEPYRSQLLSIGDCLAIPVRSQLFDVEAQA
jgi:heme-degrading monooxygenase HmoA